MKTDVVVVGSGPGGATIAKELASKGKKVTIVEWGKDNTPKGKILSDPFRFFGGFTNKSRGFMETSSDPKMTMLRCITTGGSTMAYGGVSWDPPLQKFKEYGIDLSQELKELKDEIVVKPLSDYQMGPAAKIISKSAKELGLGWGKIDRFFQDPDKFKHEAYLFGDSTGARWDARSWVLDAIGNGAVLMNETFCEKILIENNEAVGIVVKDKKNKKTEIKADTVVIAAGGVGSPVILKKSGIDEAGEKFFNDPYVLAIGYVDKELSGKEVTRQEGMLVDGEFSLGDMAVPSQVYQQIVLTQSKTVKLMKRTRALSILIEIVDELNGSVDIKGKVYKPMSDADFNKLEKGKEMAVKILENAGAKDIWFTKLAGVHPGGTCKIGEVVNSDLKTNVENLYVSDASVLPESLAIPPLMTILALSKRLSKHLLNNN